MLRKNTCVTRWLVARAGTSLEVCHKGNQSSNPQALNSHRIFHVVTGKSSNTRKNAQTFFLTTKSLCRSGATNAEPLMWSHYCGATNAEPLILVALHKRKISRSAQAEPLMRATNAEPQNSCGKTQENRKMAEPLNFSAAPKQISGATSKISGATSI